MFSIVNEHLIHLFPPGLKLCSTFFKKSSATYEIISEKKNNYFHQHCAKIHNHSVNLLHFEKWKNIANISFFY